ncbi:MAG: MotA/TolQ/ExbB proton channel family protein [Verrucomicrobiota bacterium]
MGISPILGNGFLHALQTASMAGVIVVVCLVLLSCFSWSVMLTKLFFLRRIRSEHEQFLETYRSAQNPLEMYELGTRFPYAPAFQVYRGACRELSFFLLGSVHKQGDQVTEIEASPKILASQIRTIDTSIDRALGETVLWLEDKTAVLATAVSAAPFLGLLGTVWGVMDTFAAVATNPGAASLKTMAPGVSSALVTTVIGLLVAIPAIFGYNLIVSQVKALIVGVENFAAELRTDIDKRFVFHGTQDDEEPLSFEVDEDGDPDEAYDDDGYEDGPYDDDDEEEAVDDQEDGGRVAPPPSLHSRPPNPDPDEHEPIIDSHQKS